MPEQAGALAKEIQELVGGSIIALDDFLRTPDRPYLSQYKASNLNDEFRRSGPLPKIIEGVVLLDALEFLNASADVIVFATRLIDGTWEYAPYLENSGSLRKSNSSSTKEIVDYYRRQSPLESAHLRTTLHYSMSYETKT